MRKYFIAAVLTISLTSYSQKEVRLNDEGIKHAKTGDFEKALELFTQSIEKNPSYPIAYANRGNVYRKWKQYDEAISDYTKAIELKQDNLSVLYFRANTYMDMREFDKAIADYSSIISKRPSFPDIYFNRAYAFPVRKNTRKLKQIWKHSCF